VQAGERDEVIDGVVDQLTEAMHRVSSAEPEQELDGAAPDVAALNELITAATHETASGIAFALADIRALQARLRLREAFPEFTDNQFDTIVNQGSPASHRARELHVAYNALPSTVVKALRRIDSRRDVKRAAREDFAGVRLAAEGAPTRKATLTAVTITGATGASGSPVFELHCDLDGDAIVVRTVLPSVRVPGIGGQVTIVERGDGPGRYLYVGP
jgi:hypothetical protein